MLLKFHQNKLIFYLQIKPLLVKQYHCLLIKPLFVKQYHCLRMNWNKITLRLYLGGLALTAVNGAYDGFMEGIEVSSLHYGGTFNNVATKRGYAVNVGLFSIGSALNYSFLYLIFPTWIMSYPPSARNEPISTRIIKQNPVVSDPY